MLRQLFEARTYFHRWPNDIIPPLLVGLGLAAIVWNRDDPQLFGAGVMFLVIGGILLADFWLTRFLSRR